MCDARTVENIVKHKFDEHRQCGEFFDLDSSQRGDLMKYVEDLISNYSLKTDDDSGKFGDAVKMEHRPHKVSTVTLIFLEHLGWISMDHIRKSIGSKSGIIRDEALWTDKKFLHLLPLDKFRQEMTSILCPTNGVDKRSYDELMKALNAAS
jgi:hypothetical protein